MKLFKVISDTIEASRIDEMRRYFLLGFIGQKILDPLPKCPIESMFWDWIFSYYPDNESSSCRFIGFSREYLTFLLDHKRFAADFLEWIEQNEPTLATCASVSGAYKVTAADVKLYADICKRIIREKLSCVTLLLYCVTSQKSILGRGKSRIPRICGTYNEWQTPRFTG